MERLILSWNMCKITDFEKNKKDYLRDEYDQQDGIRFFILIILYIFLEIIVIL